MLNELLFTLIAAPAASGGGEGGSGSLLSMLIPFALVFGIMYLLVIRPNQKRQKEQDLFLKNLKVGDQVVTQGGIFGKITGVSEASITIEISDRVRIKVLRSAVVSKQEAALAEAAGGRADAKPDGKSDSKNEGKASEDADAKK